MSCHKCIFVNRVFKTNEVFSKALAQIEKCESCAYNKKSSKLKQSTYKIVRLNYVKNFWKNNSKKA